MLDGNGQLRFLERTACPSVSELFGCPISDGSYVTQGAGSRSLGTIRVSHLKEIRFSRREEANQLRFGFRVQFRDEAGCSHLLPVTDLAFRRYCVRQCEEWQIDCQELSNRLTHTLQQASALFLRVGLARGWQKHPERCYVQITGVYSFPDYLGGRCFANFPPVPRARPGQPSTTHDSPT